MGGAHAREEFGGRVGIGWEAIFDLHCLHRLARFQSEKTVDCPDIVAVMNQHGL
jgi:hypothetical protein